jgi:hypothetical protein
LALHGDSEFRMNKKDTFLRIPNLKPETERKHVDVLGTLGFVETVRLKDQVCLRLTQARERTVAHTMGRWIREFGKVQRKYFRNT